MGFAEFFTQMSWIVILLLSLAAVFGIAESLTPGFGVCGTISVICAVASLVLEGVFTRSIYAVLLVLVIIIIIAIILFSVFVIMARKGFLKKTPIIESKSAIPENYGEDKEKKLLVGKVGIVISECKPVGKAEFDGKVFTIISKNKNVQVGKFVVVEEIKDSFIFVKELKGGENE